MASIRQCILLIALHILLVTAFQTPRTRPRVKPLFANRIPLFTESLLSDAQGFLEASKSRDAASTRRVFLASSIMAASATMIATEPASAALVAGRSQVGNLQWEQSPVNKRSGVTVYDAEQSGYNVRFVTYLSRFLLCFDADCQKWWYLRAADIPRKSSREQVDDIRMRQFGSFSASVAVGLQEYRGQDGPRRLMLSLLKRYCPDPDTMEDLMQDMGESAGEKLQREANEARRQIALLFGLMEYNQPVEEITKLLAAIDNGSIDKVEVVDGGSGYAPGYGTPLVTFPPPDAGGGYTQAQGRAILKPSGRILRCDLVNRGFGYSKPPTVTISPPEVMTAAKGDNTTVTTATAKAFIFRSGPNRGRLERIQLVDEGVGYQDGEVIRIKISPPEMSPSDGCVTATATAVLEYEVSGIEITEPGSGYAVEKPISVNVEAPPITARVNMNDPMMARIVPADQPLPATTIPTKELLKRMPSQNDPMSVTAIAQKEAIAGGKGGGGGCIGRACYDRAVVAVAYPRAEIDSYKSFQNLDDALKVQKVEDALEQRGPSSTKLVSGVSSGSEPKLPFWTVGESSSQLLSLLPGGVGLEYDQQLKRYTLAVDSFWREQNPNIFTSNKPIDPEFGPRGRSPIEREMTLGVAAYVRFAASGAVCCSAAHLLLTPIDVVKTKVQTNPVKYTGIVSSFKTVLKEEGALSFLNGWAPTFLGFFVWGGIAYTLTELTRRSFQEMAGTSASEYEIPIIFASSGLAAMIGSVAIAPFEAVRIRSVAQTDFAPNIVEVFNRMVKEEGLLSLFSAVPVFLLKEIPFAMAKFTVFDLSTAWMYDAYPAAKEDLQLSLLVSLLGGTLGGLAAAVVSNPADATISEMKKARTELGPVEAANIILDRAGPTGLFKGLQLRFVFYSILVSIQFLLYDAVRFALGIGSDDLKLYLDVLGGALQEKGGPV